MTPQAKRLRRARQRLREMQRIVLRSARELHWSDSVTPSEAFSYLWHPSCKNCGRPCIDSHGEDQKLTWTCSRHGGNMAAKPTMTPSHRSKLTRSWKRAHRRGQGAHIRDLINESMKRAMAVGQTFPVRILNPHPGITEMLVQADGSASIRLKAPLKRVYLSFTLGSP